MIAILVPTRGRPEQCKRMVTSVTNTSEKTSVSNRINVNLYFALDRTDESYSEIVWYNKTLDLGDILPTAHKWNLLAEEAMRDERNKLFMLGADDMVFESPGWDKALLDHYNSLENKIHCWHLQDSRDYDGTPHPIVTREYIEAMGYFVPPIFMHWFVDSWTVGIARANNVFCHMQEFRLVHDKPSDRGQADETHSRIRQFGWHQRDQWVAEKMKHVLEGEKKRLGFAINNPKPTQEQFENLVGSFA